MARQKSQTQEHLERRFIVKHGGKMDLKELWAKEEDKELDPIIANQYAKLWRFS